MLETNTIIFLGGLLFLIGILVNTLSARLGFPLLLLFLVIGMLAGEDGIGGIQFDDFETAFLVSNLALAVILLDGGLRTRMDTFRAGLGPAGVLATWGVLVTAASTGVFIAWLLDIDWRLGLLLGSIVGSTDAAAVFNLLRQSGIQLNERVGATLEIESGANDPMAIFLVLLFLEVILSGEQSGGVVAALLMLVQQFGIGAVAGLAGGRLLSASIGRMRLADGLYALLVTSGGLVLFGAVNLIGGSGFLAIYLAGLIVGNRRARVAEHVKRVMDGLAWLAQAGLFLILGLLVTPSHLLEYSLAAITIAAFVMFIARPLAVTTSLLPFRFSKREITYVSWVGLRGAVPIVLAIFPTMRGLPDSALLFDVTFVVVLTSLLIQGSTISILARKLKVIVPDKAKPLDSRELWISRDNFIELLAFRVEEDSPAVGKNPAQLKSRMAGEPELVQVVRSGKRLYARDALHFQVDDQVWLLAEPGQSDTIADYFSEHRRRGELAASRFFGEFVLRGDSPGADLASAYGLDLSPTQLEGTVADLIRKGKARHLVIGDRVALGPIRLTVREMAGDEVLSVGLKLSS
jgi:cell volume regulation protein A